MDKVEYKIRADEIKALVGEGSFAEAVKIADTIDWKRVKSVQMLCMISDLYKINRRYEESRDILLMAYDRFPTGRKIVYSLCELAIKMGEFVQAVEYYKEFVRIAPRDTARYILQYKLYEAQEVSLEERIAVLEEFKKHDYKEKWVYELAYLYHRVGLTTECIETCDELFLWLGDGNYVMKALELKALHEPLSPEQQDRYIRYKQNHGGFIDKSIIVDKDEVGTDEPRTVEIKQPTKEMPPVTDEVIQEYNNGAYQPQQEPAYDTLPTDQPTREMDRIVYPHISEIKEPSVDVSDYNTMNLQEALAENLKAVIGDDTEGDLKSYEPVTGQETSPSSPVQPITAEIFEDDQDIPEEADQDDFEQTSTGMQELFFDTQANVSADQEETDETEETDTVEEVVADDTAEDLPEAEEEEAEPELGIDIKYGGNGPILGEEKRSLHQPVYEEKPLEDEVPGAVIHPNAAYQMPSHFDNYLSQEYDGQISMAVEPEPEVEKQITGQISISEYMQNWEDFKKNQQEKQLQRVKMLVAEETGDLFADYDEKTKAGLQEKLEKAISEALKKERHDKASGRGDWSKNNEDVIDEAVDGVIKNEDIDTTEVPETSEEEPEETDVEETKEAVASTEEVAEASSDEAAESSEEGKESEETAEEKEETTEESDEEVSEDKAKEGSSKAEEKKEPEKKEASDKKADKKSDRKPEKKHDKGKRHIGNREIEERVRTMTPEEKQLFGPYIHHKKSRRQIINAIDNLSMDAFSGNAIVTGEEGAGTVNLAKGLIKAVQASDSNFSGKVAKITANTLNKKSVATIFDKLANGALIIQRAADLTPETVGELLKILQEENKGLIIVMEDTKEDMNRFLDKNPSLKQSFNVRVDIEALDDDSLVAYAKQYALEKEYAIDNLGILALHTRISERQTLDHEVTVSEVKDIIDDAIYYAEKRTLAHFVDVIVNKRYDENDMVILREKDFMH
ncbi:hypothetical protein SAMN02910275_02286 [Butyrivibrio sp. INlla18]|uniref:tetratricopeptide repeat protein n=1 Tax=Butyrivibrio sp. INlla18 TaxID=1520806 RepID=UPI00087FBB65|nr:hypothetical protein [Butyrivibrio sp. INlla18]SDA70561.1 hypothetical protein SAMN02910275_02286 [Butyrivibrio sp. INlla18]